MYDLIKELVKAFTERDIEMLMLLLKCKSKHFNCKADSICIAFKSREAAGMNQNGPK